MPANGGASHRAAERLTVLIVDDNADAAEMLATLVDALGHESIIEHHPMRALERIARDLPDVCPLDVGLPDMDGYEPPGQSARKPGALVL